MLTLCGFAASNYYNKVKIALLEKGVDFQEELVRIGSSGSPGEESRWTARHRCGRSPTARS